MIRRAPPISSSTSTEAPSINEASSRALRSRWSMLPRCKTAAPPTPMRGRRSSATPGALATARQVPVAKCSRSSGRWPATSARSAITTPVELEPLQERFEQARLLLRGLDHRDRHAGHDRDRNRWEAGARPDVHVGLPEIREDREAVGDMARDLLGRASASHVEVAIGFKHEPAVECQGCDVLSAEPLRSQKLFKGRQRSGRGNGDALVAALMDEEADDGDVGGRDAGNSSRRPERSRSLRRKFFARLRRERRNRLVVEVGRY